MLTGCVRRKHFIRCVIVSLTDNPSEVFHRVTGNSQLICTPISLVR